jgi:hypothetical protein
VNRHTESHEHKSPRCKPADAGSICQESACVHDHHVSRHIEVRCTAKAGHPDVFECVHETQRA